MINPAFANHPEEATLIGAMVIGYGELELTFGMIAGVALDQQFSLLKAFHSIRSESSRIKIADALCCEKFDELGLSDDYSTVLVGARHCLKIRNQYAHSSWAAFPEGLMFTDAERVFTTPGNPFDWKLIKLDLLKEQEAFFEYTRLCMLLMDTTIREAQLKKPRTFQLPPKKRLPSMHSQTPKALRHRKVGEPKSHQQ